MFWLAFAVIACLFQVLDGLLVGDIGRAMWSLLAATLLLGVCRAVSDLG